MLAVLCGHAAAREVYNLNRGWKFMGREQKSGQEAVAVSIPHTWNGYDVTDPAGNYHRGSCSYTRNLDVPASLGDQRAFIRFHGAGNMLTLMVNGQMAGQHRGACTAATFEVTKLLRPGSRNVLWAIVNNAPNQDILPTAGDAAAYGGLLRDVELIVTGPACIAPTDHSSDGVYVASRRTAENTFAMEVGVKLISASDRTLQVQAVLCDAAGHEVARTAEKLRVTPKAMGTLTLPFTVENPRLWDGMRDPYLYNVCVRLYDEGRLCDSVAVATGFRDFGYDRNNGFILNGKPYKLNGVTVTQERAGDGPALMPWQVEEDMALIREMGATIVNVSGQSHCNYFYDLCDREGIMVWSDLPFTGETCPNDRGFFDTPQFRQNGRQQLTEIIRQQFNHPSVVMWGLFNGVGARGEDPAPYIKELADLAKKEDPDRYTACTSNKDGEVNFITDLVLWRQRFGWDEGSAQDLNFWLSYLHRSWSSLNSAVSYGAGGSVRVQGDSLRRPDPAGPSHPERWQTRLHEDSYRYVKNNPALWGVFVNNMFDYAAPDAASGAGPGMNDFGMVTFDRKQRKDAFYFYKANWNTWEPFVYIAERRWDLRHKTVQTLKAYSNCPEVELVLNGRSLGMKRGQNGTFTWDVTMPAGLNVVELRSGLLHDRAEVYIEPRFTGSAE